jgi:chromosome segregation ATPase
VFAFCVAPAHAQAGDDGQTPKNAAECKAKLKEVNADLKAENERWAKVRGKKVAALAKLNGRADALQDKRDDLEEQMDELQPQLDAAQAAAAADPSLAGAAQELENQILSLEQDANEIDDKLDDIDAQIENLEDDLDRLRKAHRSNVRNIRAYRKQVADYCKRF